MHAYMNKQKNHIMKEKILRLKIYQRRKHRYNENEYFTCYDLNSRQKSFTRRCIF